MLLLGVGVLEVRARGLWFGYGYVHSWSWLSRIVWMMLGRERLLRLLLLYNFMVFELELLR